MSPPGPPSPACCTFQASETLTGGFVPGRTAAATSPVSCLQPGAARSRPRRERGISRRFLRCWYQVRHKDQVVRAAGEGGVRLRLVGETFSVGKLIFKCWGRTRLSGGSRFFLVSFLCHKSRKEHQVTCSKCFGRKTFRSLLHQSDSDSAASPRNSSPVQDDFSDGCFSSSSSSSRRSSRDASLLAVLM